MPQNIDKSREIGDLLLQANIERVRGNYRKALEIVKQAYELAPDDPKVLELYGDILRAQGKLKEALEMYNAALQKEHHKPSVEEKVATLTLELSEIARQEELRAKMREHPEYRPKVKNPGIAALVSMLIPGAGQVYNGDFIKGIILFAISLFSLIGWLMPVFEALTQAAKEFRAIDLYSLVEVMRLWSTLKLIFVFALMMLFAFTWTYAIVEAIMKAFELKRVVELEYEEAFKRRKKSDEI